MRPLPVLASLAVVVALLAGALFFLQRRLLYFPDRMTEDEALRAAAAAGAVAWRDAGGAIRGFRLAHPPEDARAVALVLHGNAGSALDRIHYARSLAAHGVDVALLEYPGYGARPGAPTLASLEAAAVEAIDALARERRPIWLVGESLGSGVAGRAAAARPDVVRGLVLVTPFADLGAVARRHYPIVPTVLLRDRFRPAVDLASFRHPAIVLVAGRDEVVGAAEGRRLFAALPGPKRLLVQPAATHNGVDLVSPALWDQVVRFLGAGEVPP